MRNFLLATTVMLVNCAKQQSFAPQSSTLSQQDLLNSRARAKNLNSTERLQIQQWIAGQNRKYYSAALNYWMDVPPEQLQPRKNDGEKVSYSYEIYDFNMEKFYSQPTYKNNVVFGKFEDIKAVEDALRYLGPGTEATLLVPSVLAYGTYGDNKEITNDMPLIIKLKVSK